eukprot:8314-Heterococcus_DN1.PRE.2
MKTALAAAAAATTIAVTVICHCLSCSDAAINALPVTVEAAMDVVAQCGIGAIEIIWRKAVLLMTSKLRPMTACALGL